MLYEFTTLNREEIITRCRAKVAASRSTAVKRKSTMGSVVLDQLRPYCARSH
jgi:hypothetical protein